ncbi:type II secretion system F family protein [bacterium]|nr:type II secretion system F family protein [bacterium]MCB1219756.1 type II secretion system F family protein [bacterium]UNM07558.1 MAG: type II secretion system F family protein [Planctomycetales bacterium]
MSHSVTRSAAPGVNAQTQAMAFRELSAMLHAGMPLDGALDMAGKTGPFHFRNAMHDIAAMVSNGQPASDGFREYKTMFHSVVPAVVGSAEQTGNLEYAFALLAEFFEDEADLKRTLQNAMIYPGCVTATAIGAVFVLAFLGFMQNTIGVILLKVVAGIFLFWLALRFRFFQNMVRYVAMIVPFFGGIMHQLAVARFCQTFGMMTRAGVPYLEGLEATMPVVQHPLVDRAVQNLYYGIKNGSTIEQCIRSQPAFPAIMTNLVGAGEASGSIDDMLLKSAKYLKEDAKYKIANSAKMAGPAMTIILGIIVALILVSFLQGYFKMLFSLLND